MKRKIKKNPATTAVIATAILTIMVLTLLKFSSLFRSGAPVEFATYDGRYSITVPYGYRDAGGTISEGAILELSDEDHNEKMIIMPCGQDYFDSVEALADYIEDFYLDELYGSVGYEVTDRTNLIVMGQPAIKMEMILKYDLPVKCILYFVQGSGEYLEVQIWKPEELASGFSEKANGIVGSLKVLSETGVEY